MNRFGKQELKYRLIHSVNYSLLLFIAIIVLFIFAINNVANQNISNETQILTDALNKDIIHCYSIEGKYPPDIEYMEQHFGLNYDHNKYIINYEYIGSNIMPNVTVIERNSK